MVLARTRFELSLVGRGIFLAAGLFSGREITRAPQAGEWSDRAGADFIMHCNRLDFAQKHLCFRFENRSTIIRAREPLNRLHRIKEVDHYEFDFLRSIITKNVPTPVTFETLETGKYVALQKILVSVGILNFGPTSPMTCDQESHPKLLPLYSTGLASNQTQIGNSGIERRFRSWRPDQGRTHCSSRHQIEKRAGKRLKRKLSTFCQSCL